LAEAKKEIKEKTGIKSDRNLKKSLNYYSKDPDE